jgi:FtsP/CotA-like multicopper oxidase with cupredoxin domain
MTYAMTKIRRLLLLAALLVFISPVVVVAEVYYLRAAQTMVDLPGVGPVPMWGYALDTDDNFATVDGIVTVPGPELLVTNGDLDIHLWNDLPEPTSLVINGQSMPDPAPVEITDSKSRQRMRSVTAEAAPGGQQTYSWTGLKPGTYLYQSGTHMSVQPAMGLYGAMIYDDGEYPGSAPGPNYDAEVTLLFSEVDVAQHQAVAGGTYGTVAYPTTLAVGYETDFFLLNGRSYTPDQTPSVSVGTGERVLLRMLNAGLRGRVPVIPGVTMDLVAEDGHLYTQALQQSSVDLPPAKTMDILIDAPATPGYLPIFDRRLGLHDSSNASYGMLSYLAVDDGSGSSLLTVALINPGPSDRVFMSSSPGGIDCPGDCTEDEIIDGTGVTLTADVGPGSGLFAWRVFDGDPASGGTPLSDNCDGLDYCPIDMTAARWVEAEFNSYGTVTIIAPSTSSVLTPGSYYMARWGAPATAETFDVSYNLGSGTPWVSLAEGITDHQTQWFIPAEAGNRANPRLSVIGYDATGAVDSSDITTFPITLQDQITLVAPNGSEEYDFGAQEMIQWSQAVAASSVASVSLQYQTATGTPWVPITTIDTVATPDPGQYSWTVPTLLASTLDARVGIILYDDRGRVLVQDVSDAPFMIMPLAVAGGVGFAVTTAADPVETAPPVLLLLPNGSEYILVENGFTVFWQADEAAVSFKLEISTDDGATWVELAVDVTDSQYDWQIAADLVGSQALMRITAFDADGKSLGTDVSDEPFVLE